MLIEKIVFICFRKNYFLSNKHCKWFELVFKKKIKLKHSKVQIV
jgi:hypothetical protein